MASILTVSYLPALPPFSKIHFHFLLLLLRVKPHLSVGLTLLQRQIWELLSFKFHSRTSLMSLAVMLANRLTSSWFWYFYLSV